MIKIKSINIHVEKAGDSGQPIIFLHGWGQSSQTFHPAINQLSKDYKIYSIDFPGFGKSEEPKEVLNTEGYADVLQDIIDHFNIEDPLIIGHSFGGRVAIKYCKKYQKANKLMLVNSAGIVPKKPLNYYIRVYTYKILKRILSLPFLKGYKQKLQSRFGSKDYKNSSEMMRKILVTVVNEDLREDLKEIDIPVLLFWGKEDQATPIEDAYLMQQYLKDSGIVEVDNSGHFSYLDKPYLFVKVIEAFINPQKGESR